MSRSFEELARHQTPMGELMLRRRLEPTLLVDVFEVKLGDEFLMSSLFTAGEEALTQLGLAACRGDELDVVVGGLGLGYTARAALSDPRVRSLHVIDALAEVIEWHRRHLVPLGAELTDDPRCHLTHGDFFSLVAAGTPLHPAGPTCFDAILVDIDHSPRHLLHPDHASFYEPRRTSKRDADTCIPQACSVCGPTIRPTTPSSPCSKPSSPPPTRMW